MLYDSINTLFLCVLLLNQLLSNWFDGKYSFLRSLTASLSFGPNFFSYCNNNTKKITVKSEITLCEQFVRENDNRTTLEQKIVEKIHKAKYIFS